MTTLSPLQNDFQSQQSQYTPICVLDDILPESKDIASQFICVLCKGICFDPIDIPDNDSFICQKCFNIYKADHTTYPQSNTLIGNQPLFPIQALVKIIFNLKVQCKNRNKGCEWQGNVSAIQEHININCDHQDVACSNDGCNEILSRQKLKEHLLNCDYRNESCKDCNLILPFNKLEQHSMICPKLKIKCSQGCGITIERENERKHIEDNCDKTEIECPFKELGCGLKMLRGELNEHLRKENSKHLFWIFRDFKEFKLNIGNTIQEKLEKSFESVHEMLEKKFEMFTSQTIKELIDKKSTSDTSSKLTEKKRKRSFDCQELIHELNPNNNNIIGNINNNHKNNINAPIHMHSRQESIEPINDEYLSPDNENINKQTPSPVHLFNTKHYSSELEPVSNINSTIQPRNNTYTNNTSQPMMVDVPLPTGIDCYYIQSSWNSNIKQHGRILKSCLPKRNTKHEYCFTHFDIDPSVKGIVTEWQFKVNVNSSWIGFGLCDKLQVNENKGVFYNGASPDMSNGTFGLSLNGYSWNCNNKQENNVKLKDMKSIGDSEIILFRYYNDKKELRFRLQYQKYEDKLTDVYPKKSNVLTVCVLFISGENQVELGYIKQGKLN